MFSIVCDCETKIRQNVAFVALLNEYLPHPRVLQEMANTLDTPLASLTNQLKMEFFQRTGNVPMSHQFSKRDQS